MKFEVVGRPPRKDEVREHFFEFLRQLEAAGVPEVKITFGFAWGNRVYEGQWKEELCSPSEVRRRVEDEEKKLSGRIGDDDFYISVLGEGYERNLLPRSRYSFFRRHRASGAAGGERFMDQAGMGSLRMKRSPTRRQSQRPARSRLVLSFPLPK